MPGVYQEGEYDLVGCMIGVVEKDKIINGSKIKQGDVVVGLPSTGLHTNGYTLARKVLLEKHNAHDFIPELKSTIGDALLKPHKSYSKFILELRNKINVKGLAHITGGGLIDNIPRVLPKNTMDVIDKNSWKIPPLFTLVRDWGNVSEDDMYRTFNMGIGLVILVDKKDAGKIKGGLIIGRVESGPAKCAIE